MYYDYYFYYWSYLTSLYSGYPVIVRVTVFMVVLLSLAVIFAIIRLLRVGYKLNRRSRQKEKIRTRFEEKLNFALSHTTNYDIDEMVKLFDFDIKKGKKWELEEITDLILSLRDTLRNEGLLNLINYKNVIECFGLMPFWEKRIKTSGVLSRKNALEYMGALNNGLNTGIISKSVYHKDKHLRKVARNIHTSQDTYEPFRFMEDNFDESFDQLDKVRLHATLIKRSRDGKLPNLLRWVTNSNNSNYISFIIREIGYFKQYEASPNLLAMLDTYENRGIRVQIIETLSELGYGECQADLIHRYELESNPVRQAIIQTLGVLKGNEGLNFLLELYKDTDDNNFKVWIARAIKQHDGVGERKLNELKENGKEEERLIINQVFTEKLCITS